MSQRTNTVKESRILKKRTISAVAAIPVVIAVIWFGTPWVTILAAGWGMGAAFEFYNLVKRSKGFSPLTYLGVIFVLLYIISPHFEGTPFNIIPVSSVLLTALVMVPLIILLVRNKDKENAFAIWAWTIAGVLYIGWLLSHYVALRNVADGRDWVFLAIFCTFASDISAYLVGRTIGRHKMAPYISPNKTWEGAAGGVIGSIIISLVVVLISGLSIGWWGAVILGILISIIGQLGDLVKSLFKRNMEVKDSGNVLPGHGGFLDRMDSIAFAGAVVYYLVIFTMPGV